MSTVTPLRRPKPDSQDLGTFLLILDQIPVGAAVTVDLVRSDLEAAQIKPSQYGGLFGAAVRRGELVHTGVIRVRKGSRRNGWAASYKRTRPRQAPKKTSRPATKRTDTKGPRR